MKSSSNPTGCVQNVNIKKMVSSLSDDDPMFNKIKFRKNNIHDKQFLELKSISKHLFYNIDFLISSNT